MSFPDLYYCPYAHFKIRSQSVRKFRCLQQVAAGLAHHVRQIENNLKGLFSAQSNQNIDCGYSLEPPRRGGSNDYPQSMFLSRNKKNNDYPCRPQFYYIKVGFKGVKII